MSEFFDYVERRKRVRAFQVGYPSQAGAVAQALGTDDWKLHVAGWDFKIELNVPLGLSDGEPVPTMMTVMVNPGDYVTADREVIGAEEFEQAWEREK